MCLLEYFWHSLKVELKGKRWTWTKKGLPLHSDINASCPKFLFVFSLPVDLIWHFWWGNGVKGPNNYPILVLNAKGGEIKAKATGSANHLWISKMLVLDSCCLIKTLLLQKLFSYGGKIWLWEKGGVLAFDQIYSWNISWFAKTSVFDIEIGKRICFVKINPKWDKFVFKFALFSFSLKMLLLFELLLMCCLKSPKKGILKGKCALGPFL
jgi:hypothetical protein